MTGVSAIVHVYSSRYMIGDPRYARFFAVIALFTCGDDHAGHEPQPADDLHVLGGHGDLLVPADLALGATAPAAGAAATKAFLVNAVADVGFGCAVLLTFQTFGTLDIPDDPRACRRDQRRRRSTCSAWAGLRVVGAGDDR